MRVLLTGSSGFVGSVMKRAWDETHTIRLFEGDIRDQKTIAAHGDEYDWVVHTAALTDVAQCERDRDLCFDTNATATGALCQFAKEVGAGFIYISTVSVFDGSAGNYQESDTPHPFGVYNESKRAGEELVLQYDRGVVVRLNPIGVHPNGSRGKNFVEWLVDSFAANKDITVFTDVHMNPLAAWTAADYIGQILEQPATRDVFHLGSADVCSKADIARAIRERFPQYHGTMQEGSVETIHDGVERPKEIWLNTDYTRNKLGLPQTDIASELTKIFTNTPFV
jgi:dTDP-4-dehydrorhamnose reductase